MSGPKAAQPSRDTRGQRHDLDTATGWTVSLSNEPASQSGVFWRYRGASARDDALQVVPGRAKVVDILCAKALMSGLVALSRAMRLSSTRAMFLSATSGTNSSSLRVARAPPVPTPPEHYAGCSDDGGFVPSVLEQPLIATAATDPQ